MKRLCPLLLVLGLSLGLGAREISIRLWVSGGMEGVVMGNRECPGWLSVSRQLQKEDPQACWIQLGVNPDPDGLSQLANLNQPDVVIPTEQDFRMQGREALEKLDPPGTLLNVSNLPQFPDYRPAFSKKQVWKQADGVEIHTYGLLSDQAPLRIPSDRLRPLRVMPALSGIREELTVATMPDHVFPVLVLPEGADGKEWSDRLPEIPILILPSQKQARIIDTHGGTQLRIQPAAYGRSIIRVQLYWDTIERRFSSPKAEVVWVNAPEFQDVDLPIGLKNRIRPIEHVHVTDIGDELLKHADVVFAPEVKKLGIDSRLPDAIRVSQVPKDYAWVKVVTDSKTLERWKADGIPKIFEGPSSSNREVEILMTAEIAAGNGEWDSVIRQDLLSGNYPYEWMPFTSRDLVLPLKENTP